MSATEQKLKPRPWHVVDRNWEISTVFSSSGDEIARGLIAPEADDDVDRKFELIKEANARLIAAAPDLLDALKAMVECSHTMNVHTCANASQLARAAIAKATGATGATYDN